MIALTKYLLTAVRCSGKSLATSQNQSPTSVLKGATHVNNLRKYLVSAFAAIVLSLTLANVTALATCTTDVQEEYTCYPTGEDSCYCYYDCYCKVGSQACEAALFRNGYSMQ